MASQRSASFTRPSPRRASSQRGQGLVMECYRPAAAQVLAHGRLYRLERVVPIAVTVRRQPGTMYDPGINHRQSTLNVLHTVARSACPSPSG